MTYLGLQFSPDELEAFRNAFDGTPVERLLRDIIQNIKNEAKIELQRASINIEGVRTQQGVIYGLDKLKDAVVALLELDVDEYLAREAEQNEVEEEEHGTGVFDW